ncbi:hypothetical protein A2U01_0108366, partial [Trifolium medium]|nr:hypothetical protein [Trifolium medium]
CERKFQGTFDLEQNQSPPPSYVVVETETAHKLAWEIYYTFQKKK